MQVCLTRQKYKGTVNQIGVCLVDAKQALFLVTQVIGKLRTRKNWLFFFLLFLVSRWLPDGKSSKLSLFPVTHDVVQSQTRFHVTIWVSGRGQKPIGFTLSNDAEK